MTLTSRSEGIHKLYILFANESVSAESVSPVASEVLRNIKGWTLN